MELIHFLTANRKIYKGERLDYYYQKGCSAFSGFDSETGQFVFITEWRIQHSQLEAKCAAKCKLANNAKPCSVHGVDEVIENIEKQMKDLARIRHNNLVYYECVQCEKKVDFILVYLVQEFVIGSRVESISIGLGWCEQSVRSVVRGILDALIYLSGKGVAHGSLNSTSVYLDHHSTIRVTDFALVAYLQQLVDMQNTMMRNDLTELGILIESLLPSQSSAAREFIKKCNSDTTLLTDLLDDPFLLQIPVQNVSRIQNDFTNVEYLAKGGFGDVYKVKKILDNREYAIKMIPLPQNQSHLNLMTREVVFLSRLNHKHIVRYYTSWVENVALSDKEIDSASSCYSSFSSQTTPHEYDNLPLEYMYIQMEYCDGNTLSHAIENNIYDDDDRLWDHFIQIVDGLAHIHQNGMIHRDIKPANIFITAQGYIKIGDFGLATICYQDENREQQKLKLSLEIGSPSPENEQIGTVMYTAPELNENKSQCDQKVDLYSLGIILFEMSCPPFNTEMERRRILEAIRTPSICIPEEIQIKANNINIRIIERLLHHDPNYRPSAEELLIEIKPLSKSKLLDLSKIMSDRQSKKYKDLIERCLQQDCSTPADLTYSHVPFYKSISSTTEYVKLKIVEKFQQHGGNEITTPILTPCSANNVIDQSVVRLMTNSGINVHLPCEHEAHTRFARYVTLNGITSMRRYSVEPIYSENVVSNNHPIRSYECSFDVITQKPGNLFIGAELLSMAYDITREIPVLQQKNISIRINHLNLLKALLLYFKVPVEKYAELLASLLDFSEMKITNSKFKQLLRQIIRPSQCEHFYKLSQTKYTVTHVTSPSFLKSLLQGQDEVASLIKIAVQDLQEMLKLTEAFGVQCKICLVIGLQISCTSVKSGGIVWQMLTEDKNAVPQQRILAAGQCYDTYLSDYRKLVQKHGWKISNSEVGGVGFTFLLDNLIKEITSIRNLYWSPIDVLCVQNAEQVNHLHSVCLLKSLWDAKIRAGYIEAYNNEEARIAAHSLGAKLIVTPNENDNTVILSVWRKNILYEKKLNQTELIAAIQNMLISSKERSITFRNTGENRIECNLKTCAKSKSTKKKKNGKGLPALNYKESLN